MFIGCLINLAVYAGLVYGYFVWLSHTVDPPELWLMSGSAGLFTWGALAALYNSWLSSRDRKALDNAQQQLPPQDGTWVAITGSIEATGEMIESPFSKTECVLYEYEISHEVSRSSNNDDGPQTRTVVDFSGIAMSGCAIRTASQLVKLVGFPNLEHIHGLSCWEDRQLSQAREYVKSTDWQDCSGLQLFGGVKGMWNAMEEATDRFRHDWRVISIKNCLWLSEDDGRADAESFLKDGTLPRLTEKRLEPGEQIVALGQFDAMQGTLASSIRQDGHMIRIYKDTLANVREKTRRTARGRLYGGLITLILVNGGLYLGHKAYCHSAVTQQAWTKQTREAVRKSDLRRLELGLGRISSIDVTDDRGVSLLMDAREPKIAKLLINRGANVNLQDHSGNTALMVAARQNHVEILKLLIAAGADLNTIRSYDHLTALMQADSSENPEAIDLLVAAGANDDRITSTIGDSIEATDEPAVTCIQYIEAIHAANVARLRELSVSDRPATFNDVDWDVWHQTRPVNPLMASGFVKGDDATVAVSGPTPKNSHVLWVFQLHREADQWRIVRERWQTKTIP